VGENSSFSDTDNDNDSNNVVYKAQYGHNFRGTDSGNT